MAGTGKPRAAARRAPQPDQETRVAEAARARGLRLDRVSEGRYRLVDSDTHTHIADDWPTGRGLPLDRLEQALADWAP
ncbi:hypothetical protein DQ238_01250 [Geodermatophilus sp. TF02-6]|uniref:hypothetical protein n=1 Tax=Geodermatophilus sp. TF02-6 TaxID=2250575 RepID=UPI000DEA9186|nr:hypothetical protein [Geodermatophilus sp. TF02-6]RBY83733.1 hypothetical protein DQ238_01250 [Geodermatophilus sp. TF02-6]